MFGFIIFGRTILYDRRYRARERRPDHLLRNLRRLNVHHHDLVFRLFDIDLIDAEVMSIQYVEILINYNYGLIFGLQ